MAMKKLTKLVNMDGGSAIDWIIENQHDWVLVKKDDEAKWFQEMLDNLDKYEEGKDLCSLQHIRTMIEDGIHDYSK